MENKTKSPTKDRPSVVLHELVSWRLYNASTRRCCPRQYETKGEARRALVNETRGKRDPHTRWLRVKMFIVREVNGKLDSKEVDRHWAELMRQPANGALSGGGQQL